MPTRISKETAAAVAEAWPAILSCVAAGERYSTILGRYTFNYDAMRAYRDADSERWQEWKNARKDSADFFLDEMVGIIHTPDIDPSAARVKLDACTRLVEKLNPEQYAPRTRADINVRSVDLTAIINAAQARVAGYTARSLPGDSARVIGSGVSQAIDNTVSERALEIIGIKDLL